MNDIKKEPQEGIMFVCLFVCLLGFYGKSTSEGYLTPNTLKKQFYFQQMRLAYMHSLFCRKPYLFQAIPFSQRILFQTIHFSMSIVFDLHTVKYKNSSISNKWD